MLHRGQTQVVSFMSVTGMITATGFELTIHPLHTAPRPLLRTSDSWTLLLVLLLV